MFVHKACVYSTLVCCCCSVAKSCLTFCDPIICSTPGFPVLHCIPEFSQAHVHWVEDTIQLSHPLFPILLLPSVFPSIRIFPMNWLFPSGSKNMGALASSSVLPMNIQDWFLLGLIARDVNAVKYFSKGVVVIYSPTCSVWRSLWLQVFFNTCYDHSF